MGETMNTTNSATRDDFERLWGLRLNKTGDTWKSDAMDEWWHAIDTGKDAAMIIRAYALWSNAFRREQGKRYPGCYVPSLEKWLRGDNGTLLNEWYTLATEPSQRGQLTGRWDMSRGLCVDNLAYCHGLVLGWYVPESDDDAWRIAVGDPGKQPDWTPLDEDGAMAYRSTGLLGHYAMVPYRPFQEPPVLVAAVMEVE